MRYVVLTIAIAVAFACAGCSSVFTQSRTGPEAGAVAVVGRPAAAGTPVPGPHGKLPFEKLTYRMKWVGMPVGIMETSVKGITTVNGRQAYILEAVARTNAFCSSIYKIDDRFVSYMDVEKLHTLRHEVYRREGRHKKDAVTDFDQAAHKAHYKNLTDGTQKDFDIPPDTQDTLSASYYFMLLPMKLGDRVEYSVCNNERNYRLLALIGSRGKVRLGETLGEMDGFMVEPFAELIGGALVDKGRVSAYYSWDGRRLPLYAVIRAPVFTTVTIALAKVENESSEKK